MCLAQGHNQVPVEFEPMTCQYIKFDMTQKYCSHMYRISLANALPNAVLCKFALIARNLVAFASIHKHFTKISSCCEY